MERKTSTVEGTARGTARKKQQLERKMLLGDGEGGQFKGPIQQLYCILLRVEKDKGENTTKNRVGVEGLLQRQGGKLGRTRHFIRNSIFVFAVGTGQGKTGGGGKKGGE